MSKIMVILLKYMVFLPCIFFIGLTGKKIGKLTVLERAKDKTNTYGSPVIQWKCQCECGETVYRVSSHLKRGSCRCKKCKAIEEAKKFCYMEIRQHHWSTIMKKLRPVFKIHGGKWFLKEWIISHFPKNYPALKYIEGCGGAASVLLNKNKSILEVYNDADHNIAAIVQELAADDPTEFINEVKRISYDETTFKWSETAENNALAELVRRRFSRGGLGKAFAWSDRQRGGQPGDVNAWETFKLELVDIAERLNSVEVYCLPVGELVDRFDAEDVLWYIDPPYLPVTRQAQKVYAVEMTETDHIDLATKLNKVKGKVVLSGYQSPLYTKLYKSWNLTCRPVANHSGQGKAKQKRIECLWRNY